MLHLLSQQTAIITFHKHGLEVLKHTKHWEVQTSRSSKHVPLRPLVGGLPTRGRDTKRRQKFATIRLDYKRHSRHLLSPPAEPGVVSSVSQKQQTAAKHATFFLPLQRSQLLSVFSKADS